MPVTVEGDPADALDAAGELVAELDVLVAALDVEGGRGLGNAVMAGEHVDSYLDDLRETAEDERDRAESARETLDELKTDFDEEQERLEREEQERLEREEQAEQERDEERERERERGRTKAPSSAGGSSGGQSSGGSDSSSVSGCTPCGPEIPYADDGGYTGKRFGMPGGATFRKCD